MSLQDKAVEVIIACSKHGGSWWMPLVLLAVSTANSLTGGVFIAVFGLMQACLIGIIVMERRYTFFVAPLAMTVAGVIASVTYMQIMQTSGVDALLEKTGAKGNKYMDQAQQWAQDYGVAGLVVASVLPIPTAVTCIAGVLAKIDNTLILMAIAITRFAKLMLVATVMKFGTENKTAEEFIREKLGDKVKTKPDSSRPGPPSSGKKAKKKD
jgi:membrane protein YqaA with SNARE-associated domain